MPGKRKRPANKLFQGLILISVGIHAALFYHLAGVYNTRALDVIELTVQDASKPAVRDIPRPRPKPVRQPESTEIKRPRIQARPVPRLRPVGPEPMEADQLDSLVEQISVPEIPDMAGIPEAEWTPAPEAAEAGADFGSVRDYLDLIRLRIEQNKQYPDRAKARSQEGQATVRFIISREGRPINVRIHKSSGSRVLDQAAVRAIQDAAPLPAPPGSHFSGEVPVELTIVFELT